MPKEDRSDWVAVAPEFAASTNSGADNSLRVRPPTNAYQFFQKDATEDVKAEVIAAEGKFEVGKFSRAVRDKWDKLDPVKKQYYEDLAREDTARFNRESHAADVAAMERRRKLQEEREMLLLDDEGGEQRKTRGQHQKQDRKKQRKEKKKQRKPKADDDSEEESSDAYHEDESSSSDSYDSDDSDAPKKKKAKSKPQPRKMTQKQIEYRDKVKQEKLEKEKYIEQRQEDLRKERADQAKRRLLFLLKQSSIFSHFGQVKQDQSKFGIKAANKTAAPEGQSRRSVGDEGDEVDAADLEQGDERQATFLTSQPTTLGHGTMRAYQVEGLNWMIRLQENGVNGILADGKFVVDGWQALAIQPGKKETNQRFFSFFWTSLEMGLVSFFLV